MSKPRGIVLESNNGYSTVLMEGGQYIKVRRTMEVGQIYQQERQYKKLLLAVAAALVLIFLGVVDFFNVVAYANVSNGIEIGVNRWNRVIKIEETKVEDSILKEYGSLTGQKLDEAVSIIVKDALAEEKNEEDIVIQISSEKANPNLEKKLLKRIETSIEDDFIVPEKVKGPAEGKTKNSIKIKGKPAWANGMKNGNANHPSQQNENENSKKVDKSRDNQNAQIGNESDTKSSRPNNPVHKPGGKNKSED